jgi:hypothetical protein
LELAPPSPRLDSRPLRAAVVGDTSSILGANRGGVAFASVPPFVSSYEKIFALALCGRHFDSRMFSVR